MTNQMNNAVSEQDVIDLARESFVDELKVLNRHHPGTGFGIALKTLSGDRYLLANARMPLPAHKSQDFPTGRRVARLENGEHFSSIEVLADSLAYESISPLTEAEILGNALDLIARIDTLAGLPKGGQPLEIAATGTGG
ncbi:hypothetical protein [Ruegeria sp. HKCCA6707]|uniref:hypothetical protein n=1 Tax=unclassified Ruegeria TaxID=2625375 RepID=UPI0014892417